MLVVVVVVVVVIVIVVVVCFVFVTCVTTALHQLAIENKFLCLYISSMPSVLWHCAFVWHPEEHPACKISSDEVEASLSV